jgi:GTPase SAR1 family protein
MEEWAASHKFGFIRTSAKTGENVESLFEMAVQGAFLLKNKRVFQWETLPEEAQKGRTCC